MTSPTKKEIEKLEALNKPKATPAKKAPVKKAVAKKAPAKKAPVATPTKAKPKASPIEAMKKVVEKKVSKKEIEQATKSHTSHQEHVEIAKLAYQHLHEEPTQEPPVKEESYAKPSTKVTEQPTPVEHTPSIPVHSVALAPAIHPPKPVEPTTDLPTTKEGKLKWSDIQGKLPRV